jgi:hypothetical protein
MRLQVVLAFLLPISYAFAPAFPPFPSITDWTWDSPECWPVAPTIGTVGENPNEYGISFGIKWGESPRNPPNTTVNEWRNTWTVNAQIEIMKGYKVRIYIPIYTLQPEADDR